MLFSLHIRLSGVSGGREKKKGPDFVVLSLPCKVLQCTDAPFTRTKCLEWLRFKHIHTPSLSPSLPRALEMLYARQMHQFISWRINCYFIVSSLLRVSRLGRRTVFRNGKKRSKLWQEAVKSLLVKNILTNNQHNRCLRIYIELSHQREAQYLSVSW